MYVWFDALTNYLSAIDYPDGDLARFWPANVHLIGKDIAWFHCVIWPCMLMSVDIPLPKTIVCHGFINGPDGKKMSKTIGNVVNPNDSLDKYGADAFRYFLAREGIFGQDFAFSENGLIERFDADLADDLGNLIHRTLKLVAKWSDSKVPDVPSEKLFSVSELKIEFEGKMADFSVQSAILVALDRVKLVNKWLAEKAPWKLPKDTPNNIKLAVLRTCLEAIYIIGHFFVPFIPDGITKLYQHLNTPMVNLTALNEWSLEPGKSIDGMADVLFPRIQDSKFVKKQK